MGTVYHLHRGPLLVRSDNIRGVVPIRPRTLEAIFDIPDSATAARNRLVEAQGPSPSTGGIKDGINLYDTFSDCSSDLGEDIGSDWSWPSAIAGALFGFASGLLVTVGLAYLIAAVL